MPKPYFIVNLNKGEAAETRLGIIRERVRWGIFSVLVTLLVGMNLRVFMINAGYDSIIEQKKMEILRVESEIKNWSPVVRIYRKRTLCPSQNLSRVGFYGLII